MIVALIGICEVAFWVVLAAGLCLRYALRMPRTGAVVLALTPVVDLVLLAATVIDLRRGAEPSAVHGLAALYLGFSVGYGHYLIKWGDARFRHRFAGGPPPAGPPKYGRARARHEWRLWLRTAVAVVVAVVVLQGCVLLVGDADRAEALRASQTTALRIGGIHLLVALYYAIWPPRPKGRDAEGERAAERGMDGEWGGKLDGERGGEPRGERPRSLTKP
ncbi:hypothetical protein [Streptomyces sp. URMC 123]|uniref:hypothetical protein n=1 Tax=Streptomyces sp. URMC 123 TaxID=3423403 RepID=UPI003F196C37